MDGHWGWNGWSIHLKIRYNSKLHVPPCPYAALLNGDKTYEKTSACDWYFGSHEVSDCYVLFCTEVCNAGYGRFVRTSSISYHRRRVIREGIILFRKVGTSIPNCTVSVPRRHQSWTLLYLLHVQVSSDNLLFNSSDGVCSAVSVLLFLPHTHSLCLCLALLSRPITVGASWICRPPTRGHPALRTPAPQSTAQCSWLQLSKLTFFRLQKLFKCELWSPWQWTLLSLR